FPDVRVAAIQVLRARRIRASIGGGQRRCSGQVVTAESGHKPRIWRQQSSASRRVGYLRPRVRTPVTVHANRIERWIDKAERVFLRKDRVLVGDSPLDVIDAF